MPQIPIAHLEAASTLAVVMSSNEPLLFLFYNRFAVVITLVHIFLPFAILLILAALEGVDVLIHCAARVHVMNEQAADPLAEFRRANVEGTLCLARQAVAAGQPDRSAAGGHQPLRLRITGQPPLAAPGPGRVVDAALEATLAFGGGVTAKISSSMVPNRMLAQLTAVGSLGRLDITNFIAPQIGCRSALTIGGKVEELPIDPVATFEAQLEHVVQVMRGQCQPIVGGTDSLAHMGLIDEIYRQAGH